MKLRSSLSYPFRGFFPLTFGFGDVSSNREIAQRFEELHLKGHEGLDFGLPAGTTVYAAYRGIVVFSGDNGHYGKTVIIKHSWGESLYAHMKFIKVPEKKHVRKGHVLGLSGSSGFSFGSHLHFAIRPIAADPNNGYAGFVDPTPYFVSKISKNT